MSAISSASCQGQVLTMPSLSRLRFDNDAYQATLRQSVGPGNYVLETVKPHCGPCLPGDARLHVGTSGVATCSGNLVDVESDLHNIGRKASLAPGTHYRGDGGPPTVCGANARLQAAAACDGLASVDTRLANPPCTLRGTGWNRWEWLCRNPQDHVLMPFDAYVDTSLVVKDNHRPHVARPLDPTLAMPPGGRIADPAVGSPQWMPKCSAASVGPVGESPNILWRTCDEVARM